MRNVQPHQVQGANAGRYLAGWFPSRPYHPVRTYHRHVSVSAAVRDPKEAIDLIHWPEGTRPKRGGVTKASLTRLKVTELKAELQRLGAEVGWLLGTKDQLAERLLQLILEVPEPPSPAAAAPTPAATAPASGVAEALATAPKAAGSESKDVQPAAAAAVVEASTSVTKRKRASASRQTVTTSSSSESPTAEEPQALDQLQQQQQQQQQQQLLQQLLQQQQEQAAVPQQTPAVREHAKSRSNSSRRSDQRQRPVAAPQSGRITAVDPAEAARVAAEVGVKLEDLPPLPEKSRGQVYDVEQMAELNAAEQELVLKANRAGVILTLLGGAYDSAAAAGEAAAPCLGLLRDKDIWLFDAGEDVQRSVQWREHMRPSKMHRVVITRQTPDAMLGLPGILCIIGASREKGHEIADIPVHVFAPEGTADLLSTMYECSNTFLEMPVVVHEFVTYAVSEDERQPQRLNTRAKIWRALMPPDQLNPQGWINGAIDAFMPTQGRARVKKGGRAAGGVLAVNPRAGYRPFILPPPGDPELQGLAPSDMVWTIVADEAAMMKAVLCESEPPSWAIVWQEADKQGNLSIPRCDAMKIDDPNHYTDIKCGATVPNADGVLIPPGMLCSADKPGRKVVLLPACSSAENLAPYAADADVMLSHAAAAAAAGGHDGGYSSRSPTQQQQHTQLGLGLGELAERLQVRNLVLTGLPGKADTSSSTKWRLASVNSRSRGNSRESTTSKDPIDSSDGDLAAAQQQQQHQQRLDPEVAAVVAVVSERYTCGHVWAARDDMSLIVEENAGSLPAGPVDLADKTAQARATTLNVLSLTQPPMDEREMRYQRERTRRLQERQQKRIADKARGRPDWRSAKGEFEQRTEQGFRPGGQQRDAGFRSGSQRQQQLLGYRQGEQDRDAYQDSRQLRQRDDGDGYRQQREPSGGRNVREQQRDRSGGGRQQQWNSRPRDGQQQQEGAWHQRGRQHPVEREPERVR